MRDDVAGPDGSALSEGLGPLVERIGSPPDTHCWDDDSAADCWSYSPQMVVELLAAERERCAAKAGEYARKWWTEHCRSNHHMATTRKAHDDFCELQVDIRRA